MAGHIWAKRSITVLPMLVAVLIAGCGDDTVNNYYDDTGDGPDVPLPAPGIDTDGDGLDDRTEIAGWKIQVDETGVGTTVVPNLLTVRTVTSDPESADTDGDGLEDRLEQLILSDPRLADTDGDGLNDYAEWFQWLTSPVSVDSDGDARGPNADLAPNAALFDGNELSDRGTSPTLADTDGDGKTDFEEYDDPVRHQLIAEIPELAISFEGDVDVRLNVQYAEALGQETQYGTTMTQSQTTSTSRTDSDTQSQTLSIEQSISYSFPGFGGETKIGFEYGWSQTTSFTQGSSQTAQEEHSKYLTDSVTKTETAASGSISLGLRATNRGVSTVELDNLGLTIIQFDRVRQGSATVPAFRTVATLAPDLGGITLAPGDSSPLIRLAAENVNAAVIKEFLANPTTLYYETASFELLSETGINFDFIAEQTFARTAFIEIDFGDGDIERYRVATNVARDAASNYTGVTLGAIMHDILDIPYTTAENPNLPGQRLLASVRGVAGTLPASNEAIWAVSSSSDAGDPAVSFDDIIVRGGDSLRLLFLTDSDSDGVYDLSEELFGSGDDDTDTDGDGLSDREEILDGWQVGPVLAEDGSTVVEARFVFSDPRTTDADNDGLGDLDERSAGSDPYNADTDGDGLSDGFEVEYDTNAEGLATTIAPRLHVDQASGGAGPGTNWDTAFAELRDALADVRARHQTPAKTDDIWEVWVAAGVYTPTLQTGNLAVDRAQAFRFDPTVPLGLYGGFSGYETKRDQRITDARINGTVLSGDLAGDDDASVPTTLGENSFHVVTIVPSPPSGGTPLPAVASEVVVLDGFMLTGGNANGAASLDPPFMPDDFHGGGVFVADGKRPELRNLFIVANRATQSGAGMFLAATNVGTQSIQNVVFSRNDAGGAGGGLAALNVASLEIDDSTFEDNFGGGGGALYLMFSDTTVRRTSFLRNISSTWGGALRQGYGRTSLIDTRFRQNSTTGSSGRGGAIAADVADIEISQSVIVENETALTGGGVYGWSAATRIFVTNSTIARNSFENLAEFGSGIRSDGPVSVVNSVISGNRNTAWGDSDLFNSDFGQIYSTRAVSVLSSCLERQTGYSHVSNLNAQGPEDLFVDPQRGDYRLKSGSICIDNGNSFVDFRPLKAGIQSLPETDIAGAPRIADGNGDGVVTVDMGAHESPGQ